MSTLGTLKYGLRPTVKLAGNIAPFAGIYALKKDDLEGHAKAIAELVGAKEIGDAISECELIHVFSISRVRDQIFLQTNFDGDLIAYFEAHQTLEEAVREILSHLDGAPEPGAEFTKLLEFLAAGQVDVIAYYCAYPELTVSQIRRDADWRIKVVELQKSLAYPTDRVAWGQTVSGLKEESEL